MKKALIVLSFLALAGPLYARRPLSVPADSIVVTPRDTHPQGKTYSYCLAKSGKIFGRDSVYIFDMAFDCQSEGFIRFRDPATGNVGMFDRHGNVAIPAEYSDLTRVKNGTALALKGAKLVPFDEEHSVWEGGTVMLIDTSNRVLDENIHSSKSFKSNRSK